MGESAAGILIRGMATAPSLGVRASDVMTIDALAVSGSRKETVSVFDCWFQSATVAPETWLTVTPAGMVNAISRVDPCFTSAWTPVVIALLSSPSTTSDVSRPSIRNGIVDRRSSVFRFQEKETGRPGEP